jgi:hypothetical protein
MDAERRDVVLRAVREHAGYRGWQVLAAHVRTRHVHVVVSGDVPPERMMNAFKALRSRALTAAGFRRQRRAPLVATRLDAVAELGPLGPAGHPLRGGRAGEPTMAVFRSDLKVESERAATGRGGPARPSGVGPLLPVAARSDSERCSFCSGDRHYFW